MPKIGKNIQVLLVSIIAAAQGGCAVLHPARESAFRVKGTILTDSVQPTEPCVLELYRKKGDHLVQTVDVPAKFDRSMVIAPGEHEYYMILHCQGRAARFKTKVYKLGRVYYLENPVDLGEISLRDVAPASP